MTPYNSACFFCEARWTDEEKTSSEVHIDLCSSCFHRRKSSIIKGNSHGYSDCDYNEGAKRVLRGNRLFKMEEAASPTRIVMKVDRTLEYYLR